MKPVEYIHSQNLVSYPDALSFMEARVAGILNGEQPEALWFIEHPPLYTSGTSAKTDDLLGSKPFPVYDAGRGGEWTYHGPGQRVVYVMLDLKQRGAADVRRYVQNLEQWIIATLAHFGVEAFTREGRIGVWVNAKGGEAKVAALGIRVRKWITFHGIALNVHPDLSHYAGIVPCGIKQFGVTSLKDLGINASMEEVDAALKKEFEKIF
jgi:lipoyl(octanoyl) transferase